MAAAEAAAPARPTAVTAVLRIPVDQIDPGPNARGALGDVNELAASLRALGQQVPAVVEPTDTGRWRLVDGHRRHAAALKAGVPHLDVIVRPPTDDARRTIQQMAIQVNARQFDPMAEARALHALMFEHRMTREAIARQIGRPPSWVRDRVGLVHLEPNEQRALESGRMSVGEALLRLKGRRKMREGRAPATRKTSSSGGGEQQSREQKALQAVRQAVAEAMRAGASTDRIDAAVVAGRREVAG